MLIPEGERFSRVYRGRGELTDHLLVSHALVGTASAVTTGEFKSPLAHANEMAPDLGFSSPGWGSFASEVLEKVLSVPEMGGEAVYGRPLHGRGDVGVDVHRRGDR